MSLTLKETWHLDGGPGSPSKRVLRYAVQGLPPGEEAEIAEFPQRNEWSILRIRQGVIGKWSDRRYKTPEDALSALTQEIAQ